MAGNSNLTFELNLMAALGEGALVALSLVHVAPSAGKAIPPYGLVFIGPASSLIPLQSISHRAARVTTLNPQIFPMALTAPPYHIPSH